MTEECVPLERLQAHLGMQAPAIGMQIYSARSPRDVRQLATNQSGKHLHQLPDPFSAKL